MAKRNEHVNSVYIQENLFSTIMGSLIDTIQETILTEERKNSESQDFIEIEKLLDSLKKSGFITKPDYTFPLVDTIGKRLYASLNEQKPL